MRIVSLVVGPLCILLIWETIALSGVAGLTVPTIESVVAIYFQPRFIGLLFRSTLATAGAAILGLFAGTLLGVSTALLAHVAAELRPGLDRLAVTLNAIPAVALGPILVLLVGREHTPAILASVSASFLIYVSVSSGLRTARQSFSDVLTTFGANKWQRLFYLDIPSAVPRFLGGFKVSVTAAMIGAIIGEWFGAPKGLGIVLLNTMQNFEIPLMWATVLIVTTISLAGYGAAHLVERLVGERFI
jgi:NitT/TauT family transport system permease protein